MTDPDIGMMAEPSSVTSLGAVLKASRENKQLTLEEVSLRINIPLKHLESLEHEQYDQLPGMPFAKGYLRSYAKVLELNADGLIAQFIDEAASKAESRVASINKVGQQVNVGHPVMRISLILFVCALLGVSFWWWQTQASLNISELSQPEVLASEESEQVADVKPGNVTEDPTDIQARLAAKREEITSLEQAFTELNAPVEIASSGSSIGLVDGEPATEDEPVYLSPEETERLANSFNESAVDEMQPSVVQKKTEEEATITATQGFLEIQFSADCWVSIRDASDKLVFANTKRAGETLSLNLELPASVLIGKVSAVESAVFNGNALDLASEAKKDVAKITLAAN